MRMVCLLLFAFFALAAGVLMVSEPQQIRRIEDFAYFAVPVGIPLVFLGLAYWPKSWK